MRKLCTYWDGCCQKLWVGLGERLGAYLSVRVDDREPALYWCLIPAVIDVGACRRPTYLLRHLASWYGAV